MAIFIELVTDAFEDVFRSQAANHQGGSGGRSSRAGKTIVRRPVRGIEIKDDTYAYLKVIMANGKELPLLDSSSYTGTNASGYTNFILQSVTEQRMEKHQIVETFGDSYVFFFGESPRFLDCQAVLINTHDFNWRAEWWHNYENYLRGTKLVELGARCYMLWDDNVVEGYMLMASANEVSEQPYTVSLQFRYFVTKYQNVNLSTVEQFPVRSSVFLPPGVELTQADAFDRLQAYYRGESGMSRAESSVVREESLISWYLQQGGAGTRSLASNSPTVQQSGPSTYYFGAAVGASASASVSTAADLGLSVASYTGQQQSTGGLAQYQTITQKIRQLPPSIVTDPAIWNALKGTTGIVDVAGQSISTAGDSTRGALRGLIAENIDEYVNGNDGYPGISAYLQGSSESFIEPLYALNKAITQAQELSYSLPYSVITTLNALGVSADNPQALEAMGLAPNFSDSYVASSTAYATAGSSASYGASVGASVSFGGSSSSSVSFSPLSNSSLGAASGASTGLSARAGYYANATSSSSSYLATASGYTYRDPLGAVYGTSTVSSTSTADAHKYVEGVTDPNYGYTSPYGGAGYGCAGFGDFGGTGFGGCSSSGDPGFRDPILVGAKATTLGTRARCDMTAVTPGPSLGGATAQGGASMHVGGSYSSFSTTAVSGSFSSWVLQAVKQQSTSTQSAVGPGYSGISGNNLGYAAYKKSKYPASVTYVAQASAKVSLTTSFGFN